MAKSASAESVQADMQPPNFRAAVQKVRTITAKKDKIGSVNGEIADIYAKIEGHKVNRQAAKIFYALDRMEMADRNDVLRSLEGLLDAAGYDEEAREDLVDKASKGDVLPMRRTMTAEEGRAEMEEAGGYPGEDGDAITAADVAGVVGEIISDGVDVAINSDDVPADVASVEDILARCEAAELAETSEAAPNADPDAFTEASEEELKAQAGRGAKGGGRKGATARSVDNVHPLRA